MVLSGPELQASSQRGIFQGYIVVIFLYVPLLQFATIHRGERDENWSNKEVLIALLWAASLSRARPSTETIAILSRRVVHCTIIKYDDAALLFKYLSMATIGESRSPISSPSPPHPRDRVPRKDRRDFLRRCAVGLPTWSAMISVSTAL